MELAGAQITVHPLVLTFVFAFPVVTMLVIGGAFSTAPEPGAAGANPSGPFAAARDRLESHEE